MQIFICNTFFIVLKLLLCSLFISFGPKISSFHHHDIFKCIHMYTGGVGDVPSDWCDIFSEDCGTAQRSNCGSETRTTEDQWQSSIDRGDLSLDFHATGHFTDISPNAKTNTEKLIFTSQSPLGKDTTQTIEHSLNMLTANMESLSAQMMYLGQTLSDRMGQFHSTVTGMQQDTDTFAIACIQSRHKTKICKNNSTITRNFWTTCQKY